MTIKLSVEIEVMVSCHKGGSAILAMCLNLTVSMVQATAVGPSTEDRVADGSCGSCWSFGRGLSAGSVEAVGSSEKSWMVACLQQSSFWQVTNVLMQQLLDVGSLMNLVPATFW
jgi:hypothetical protein